MQPNDRVTWNHEPRGGYGYVIPVAGIVRKVTDSRVTIEVARKVDGVWVREKKSVKPGKLVSRSSTVEALDESGQEKL